MTTPDRALVVHTEAGVLRQNGARLTDEWWADATAYQDGTITLDQWRARNRARHTTGNPLQEDR